jgi:DNA-binding NarL/FixJ family response regulator
MSIAEPSGRPAPDREPAAARLDGTDTPRRVLVVDDHELLRAGTRRILDEATGFSVVGEAADGHSALREIDSLRPDVVLVDIRLPDMNGIDLARRILQDHPDMAVLILSAYDDQTYVRASLAAGVAGYLLKTAPGDELVHSIRAACDAPATAATGPSGRGEKDGAWTPGDSMPPLTAREREVVHLASRGMSNKAIAHELGISPRTVEGHLNRVFEKLGATSRTELVHYALANSLFARAPTDGPGSS